MKLFCFRTLACLALLLPCAISLAQVPAPATDRIKRLFPGAKVKQAAGGLFEVDTKVYVSQDGRTVLVGGRTIDAEYLLTGVVPGGVAPAPAAAQPVARRTTEFAKLPQELAITLVKGDGSRKLAVFTDVDCPFCKQLEKTLDSVTDVSIQVFLLPIDQLHPDARRKSEAIWCAADRAAAWREYWANGKLGDDKCSTPFAAIGALAEALGINGTPTLIRASDGAILPGALQKERLESWLGGK
jgi:thiol:disulfide interchange protein DsbC